MIMIKDRAQGPKFFVETRLLIFFQANEFSKDICTESNQHSTFLHVYYVLCTELKAMYRKIKKI